MEPVARASEPPDLVARTGAANVCLFAQSETAETLRLGLFAIVKDEAPYLEEWLAHHRAAGFTHFFIADNGSSDGSRELLHALAAARLCHVIEFLTPADQAPQLAAYRMLADRFAAEVDWMAFIDADEFVVVDEEFPSIRHFLAPFHVQSNIGAVALNWACYGSSGRRHFESGFVVQRFDRRAEQDAFVNHHYKSFVRSRAFAGTSGNPHHFLLKKGYSYATAGGERLVCHPKNGVGLSASVVWQNARINHYVVKSEQEFFERKVPRGRATVTGQLRSESYFRGHDRNEVHEPFPPALLDKLVLEYQALKALPANQPSSTLPIAPLASASALAEVPATPFYRAVIDRVERHGMELVITGWALSHDNGAVEDLELHAGKEIIPSRIARRPRPDVVRVHPEASGDIGFKMTASLSDPALMLQTAVEVCSGGLRVARVPLADDMVWLPDMLLQLQVPVMPQPCVEKLEDAMQSARVYLEYGTGGSTNLAAGFPHLSTVSVESDWNILRTIKLSVAERNRDSRIALLYADIGPTGENSFPTDESAFREWHRYAVSPWLHCAERNLQPDLVLIDGRFRRACLLASLIFSAPGTRILFDDYIDRPHYHAVEKHLSPSTVTDRMAEFVTPPKLGRTALWLDLLEAVNDPR